MPWTWSRIIAAVFIFAGALVFFLTPHNQFAVFLNTIGIVFLFIYSRKYGKRVKAPFDHESLHLF